jgi:hypothetical protein
MNIYLYRTYNNNNNSVWRNVFAITFGDVQTAHNAAKRVRHTHRRIKGVVPESVGVRFIIIDNINN